MNSKLTTQAYALAKERYAAIGIDTEEVLEQLRNFHLSMHCWQADDVKGFEVQAGALSGGIQSTGNYPGAPSSSRQEVQRNRSCNSSRQAYPSTDICIAHTLPRCPENDYI